MVDIRTPAIPPSWAGKDGDTAGDHLGNRWRKSGATWSPWKDGSWVVTAEPSGSLGLDGDQAYDTSADLAWRKEGSVWVPQTSNISKIVPSASQLMYYDAAYKSIDQYGVTSLLSVWGSDGVFQATDSFKPAWGGQEGRASQPMISFDGSNDLLAGTSLSGPLTGNVEFHIFLQSLTWANGDEALQIGQTETTKVVLRQLTSTDRWSVLSADGASVEATTTDGANDTSWHGIRGWVDFDNDLVGIQVDGGTPSTTANTQTAGSKNSLTIGGPTAWNGNVMALVISSTILSVGRRIALARWANQRWFNIVSEPTA